MLSKRKKPVTKGHVLNYPIYIKVQDYSRDSITGYQGWEGRNRESVQVSLQNSGSVLEFDGGGSHTILNILKLLNGRL